MAAVKFVLPRCPVTGPNKAYMDQLINGLQLYINAATAPVTLGTVVANDVTVPASFDPVTATLPETAMAFAALLQAQQKSGLVN